MGTVRSSPRRDLQSKPPAQREASSRATPLLEVRLDLRSEGQPLTDLLYREGAEAHLIACRLSDRPPRRLLRWLDVAVDPVRRERLLHALRHHRPSRALAIATLGPGRLLVRVSEPAPSICVTTYRANGICVECPLLARAEHGAWRVIVPRGNRTKAFLRELPAAGAGPWAIARLKPGRSASALTRRQDLALRTAYDLGYFGYPRRGSLGDVGRALGTGRSATLEILRRAMAKLAQGRYGDGLRSPRTV